VIYNPPAMNRTSLLAFVGALCLVVSAACGSGPDLAKALEVTEVLTGYYDGGIKDGKTVLPPSISFRLHNRDTQSIGPVQLTVSFWKDGEPGEWDSVLVQGITADGLAPGASTPPLLARAPVAYTLEGARADFFSHSLFKDVTIKMFASRAGIITKLDELKVERRILPHLESGNR
jgi:hypothetical protein